jgi:hypothetical protein
MLLRQIYHAAQQQSFLHLRGTPCVLNVRPDVNGIECAAYRNEFFRHLLAHVPDARLARITAACLVKSLIAETHVQTGARFHIRQRNHRLSAFFNGNGFQLFLMT